MSRLAKAPRLSTIQWQPETTQAHVLYVVSRSQVRPVSPRHTLSGMVYGRCSYAQQPSASSSPSAAKRERNNTSKENPSGFFFVLIINYKCTLKQPIMPNAGTISEEKWNSLHTIEELDVTLKRIIHNHFHG